MRRKRGPNCTLRIVLMCLRDAEDGQDGVTGELLRRPAEPLDLRIQHFVELALEVTDILRVELLAERRKARKVGEEDGDDATLVCTCSPATMLAQSGTARGAEERGAELLGSACRTNAVQRRTTHAAEASIDRLVGAARSAGDPHESSLGAPPLPVRRTAPLGGYPGLTSAYVW